MNATIEVGVLDRTTYIGSADAAPILGVSPWTSAFLLYQKKIGEFVEEVTPAKQRIFDRGHRWEPIVVEMLLDELRARGHEVEIIGRNNRYKDPEHPFIAAEIDVELLIDGEEVNGEAKTVNPFAVKAWGDEDSDEIPIYYAAQVMHGLMVRPRRRAVIAALTGFDDKPRIHWIDRDEETIAAIRSREVEFWQRVLDRNPPPAIDPEDVKWLYQRDGGQAVVATNDQIELVQHLKDMKASAKAQEAQIELTAARVKSFMGTAATLLGPDGMPLATWKSNKDSVVTDWKAAYLSLAPTPDHIKQFTTTKAGARPFNLK